MDHNVRQPFYKSMTANAWVSAGAVVAIILFYAITRHQQHTWSALPYILLTAAFLPHLFMHGSHGGYNHGAKKHE